MASPRPPCAVLAAFLVIPATSLADADIGITIDGPSTPLLAGQHGTFTVTASNFGPDPSSGVRLSCQLGGDYVDAKGVPTQGNCTGSSAIDCELGTISPEPFLNSALVYISFTAAPVESGAASVACMVTATIPDPDLTTNSRSSSVQIVPLSSAVDLRVTVEQSPSQAYSGELTTITVVVENRGPAAASVAVSARMRDLKLSSYRRSTAGPPFCISSLDTCAGFGCVAAAGDPFQVRCDLGSISPGQTSSGSFGAVLAVGTWTVTGTASSGSPDPTPGDASAAREILVIQPAFPPATAESGCVAGRSNGGLWGIAAFVIGWAIVHRRSSRVSTSPSAPSRRLEGS